MSDVARTSVNQAPGGGTDYPFTGPGDLSGVVLDFYVSYDDAECAYALPFTLTSSGDDLTVTDAGGGVVAYVLWSEAVTRAWGSRTVHQWEGDDFVVRAVTASVADGQGTLDARTCDRLPARVKSVRVGLVKLTGNVRFEAGYNIDLAGALPTDAADGGRYASQISMDAVAGAGAGRVDGCEELTPQVRKINQVGPDCSGNFKVEVDPCFRVGPPLAVTGAMGEARTAEYAATGLTAQEAQHAVRLTSDCHPCCECDYFVRTYRGLKRQWERWKGIASSAESVRDVYEANRTRWMESRQCRIDNPARLVVSTDFQCKTFVGGSFCNFTQCCLVPVEIRLTFRRYKAGVLVPWTSGSAVEAYISGSPTDGDEKYAPQSVGSGEVVRFFLDYANPQDTSVVKLKFCTTACAADESVEVTMTVHIPDAAGNPESGDPCTMATVAPPSWLTDIWTALAVDATPTVRALLTKTAALNPNQPKFNCGC